MASSQLSLGPQMYTVGWIAALDKELAAATAVLDEEHKKPKGFKKHPRDDNNYAWGRIGDHHVVIASMAAGRYGTVSAATTAMQMVSSIPHLRFGLMVGIGAGVPRLEQGINIRLGDIVVSYPTETSPGVVQYDLGRLNSNGKFERVGSLAAPPEVLLKGLMTLKAYHMRKGSRVPKILEKMFEENPRMAQDGPDGFRRPDAQYDQLFETSHLPQGATTASNVTSDRATPFACPSPPHENERPYHPSETPKVHYGIIASGNAVVKDGIARDEILKRLEDKCICFEMEAAGLMNNFPCLVIRGVCDYADEHKNDRWQKYAAATAAAFTKELLEVMHSEDIENISPIESIEKLGDKIAEMRVAQNETNSMIQSRGKDDHSRELQRWLSPPDPSTNYNKALHQRHQGSGVWFLRSSEYSAWKPKPDSFLWLYGMPGCGKTILSSTVIQDLMEGPSRSEDLSRLPKWNFEGRGRKRVNNDDSDARNPNKRQKNDHRRATNKNERQKTHQLEWRIKEILLYFYFDFTDNRKQSLENMLRSFISQLCSKKKDLGNDLSSLYLSCSKGNLQPSVELLRGTFLSMVAKAGEVWIVIDALDECQTRKGNQDEGLLGWMESLRSSQKVNIHFLVTSRPEQDIQSAIEEWAWKTDTSIATLSIESDRTAEDIQDYIHARVTQSEGLRRWRSRPDIQNDIQTTLTAKAHGMFRWVSCQLNVLEDCYDPQTLRKALVSLPKTLGETYMRILANVPDCNRHQTTRLLQFLTFSQRPLCIEELVDAIAVNLEHKPPFDIRDRMPVPMEILRYCSSLVVLSEDTHEVRLAHFSVKEFIISQEEKGIFTQSLNECTAHESIIEIIIAYLLSIQDTGLNWHELDEKYHLSEYCAKHWIDHARIAENSASARQRLLELFSNKDAWCLCTKLFNPDGRCYWPMYGLDDDLPNDTVEPLYIASLSGLKYLVKDLLLQGANIDANTGNLGTALRAACESGYSDIATILVESGADVDIVGGSKVGTALVTAIDKNLIDIACLQINRGANPSTPGYIRHENGKDHGKIYPLHLACMRGAEMVVKALIDKNVDINFEDETYGSPLGLACGFREDKVVKLLLEHGANSNAQENSGDTPLHRVLERWQADISQLSAPIIAEKSERIVHLLLKDGANVHTQDLEGRTPLHNVAARGTQRIAQLMLEQGADINTRDGNGRTPLHTAIAEMNECIVQLLLENGAHVNTHDKLGRTPLHTAAAVWKECFVQLLLKHGADTIHVPDNGGRTPLEIAEGRFREKSAELLRVAGDVTFSSSRRYY